MAENLYKNLIEIPQQGVSYFRHFLIPHEGNDHKPALIRPTALKVYSIALITVKLVLTGFLYAVYPTEGQFAELTASKIVELTNASRAEEGLPALVVSTALTTSASRKANDMLAQDYFDHTGPDGKKFWQWITEAGYSYATAGENLAMDFTTAESAHNALMASPSHRKNLMKEAYVNIGIAVVEGELNGKQTTLLVEHFGAPASQPTTQPPSTPPPTTPPPTTPPPTAPAPTYEASYVGRSDEQYALLPGSDVEVWVDFKNTGTATWTNSGTHFLALNVTDPSGRTSSFQDASWLTSYRPAVLEQSTVTPGNVGRFRFTLHAPEATGDYTEAFAVVAEDLAFLSNATVALPITIVPAPTPAPVTTATPTPQEQIQTSFNTTTVDLHPTDCPVALAEDGTCPAPATSIVPDDTPASPTVIGATTSQAPDWLRVLVDSSQRFFWAFLLFLVVALFLNVMVKVRVQHRHVILQTLAVIALASLLTFVRFHFAEGLSAILIT